MEAIQRKGDKPIQNHNLSDSSSLHFCDNCRLNGLGFEKVEESCDIGMIQSVSFVEKKPDSQRLDLKREETYFEKLRNYGTNLRYNLEEIGENIRHADGSNNTVAYLLGKGYPLSTNGIENTEEVDKMTKRFSDIIWFSYRRNFPKLNYEVNPQAQSYVSDTSWGCMIRACQMMFAECLRRYSASINEQEIDTRQIIEWFLDTEVDPKKAPYSIQNICRYLNKHFNLGAGIWLKSSNVLFALQGIQKEFGHLTAEKLETEIYIEGTIYVTNALKKMVDESVVVVDTDDEDEEENNKKVKLAQITSESQSLLRVSDVNFENNESGNNIKSIYLETPEEIENLLKHKWDGSLAIFILAKTGLDKPNPDYIPFIKDLLSYPESIGMIAGKPGLAYYIVGYTGDKLMYFDPHFVQEAVQKKEDLKEHMHTYFKTSIRHVGINEIDTSLTFGFFIKDEVCFKRFLAKFRRSCAENESFFGVELNEPQVNENDCASIGDEDEDQEGDI